MTKAKDPFPARRTHRFETALFNSGTIVSLGIAGVSLALDTWWSIPSAMLAVALAMGFATALQHFGPSGTTHMTAMQSGYKFASGTLLRAGVALLGLQLSVPEIIEMGAMPPLIAIITLMLTLALARPLSSLFSLPLKTTILATSAVAICGASAAMAVALVLRVNPRTTVIIVLLITIIGTLAMLFYPIIGNVLGWADPLVGIFLGASLHEVAHATAAGFSVSQTAGEYATITKLVRVGALAPLLFILAAFHARTQNETSVKTSGPNVPSFLILFAAFSIMASLFNLPPGFIVIAAMASKLLILSGLAGICLSLSLREISRSDRNLTMALLVASFVCAIVAGGLVHLFDAL